MRQPLFASKRYSRSRPDAEIEDPSIPHEKPVCHPKHGSRTLRSSHRLITASCMDLGQKSRQEQYGERNPQHPSSSSRPQTQHIQGRPASHTGALAPNQWEAVPLPYRPRNWQDPKDEPLPAMIPDPLFSWRLRPSAVRAPGPRNGLSLDRRRSGPAHYVRQCEPEQQARAPDSSFLYHQLSPYDDTKSRYSAPEDLHNAARSLSQPATPALWDDAHLGRTREEPHSAKSPRAPTYPPATRRHARVANSGAEATFTDEEEFHLFVQATAGLGPEQAFRLAESPQASRMAYERFSVPIAPRPSEVVSPIQETPTTMRALQQLAQLPHHPRLPQASHVEAERRPESRRLDIALAGVDLWLHPPSAVSEECEVSPIDNELPDYASSQAQAQAAQRAEATARARELQRRWAHRTS